MEIFAEQCVRSGHRSDGRGAQHAEVLAEAGVGVRLRRAGRSAYAYGSGLDVATIRRTISAAAAALSALSTDRADATVLPFRRGEPPDDQPWPTGALTPPTPLPIKMA